MRILAASDLHGESKIAKKLAEKAAKSKAELVILCGDLTGFVETKNFLKPFKDKKQKVLLVPGNHDSFATADFLANLYGLNNIHGYSAVYDKVGFFGAGGAENLPKFPGAITEKQMMQVLEKAHSSLKGIEKKIMITHMHPSESISEFSGFEGSKAITRAIKKFKPDILIHGHIHEAEGMEDMIGKTRIFNVGPEGKIIDI